MPDNNQKLLPCIQAIGPWWTERDRILLFCFLKSIFNLESEYIASLPQAKGSDENGPFHIEESVILREYECFKKNIGGKKASCPRLKEQSFSFGKMNSRLCSLCPFSREFKNNKIEEEYRLFYYFLVNKTSLKEYFGDMTLIKDVFRSYFPACVNNVLVDAYPFSFIMENVFEMDFFQEGFSDDVLTSDKLLLDAVHKKIERRIPYIRIKNLLMDYNPGFSSDIISSADSALKKLMQDNAETRVPGDLLIKRLFSLLKDRGAYTPMPASEYKIRNEGLLKSTIFQKGIPGKAVQKDISPLELLTGKMSGSGLRNLDAECIAMAEQFSSVQKQETTPVLNELPSSTTVSVVTHTEKNEDKSCRDGVPDAKIVGEDRITKVPFKNNIFSHFYEITDSSSVFIYGSTGNISDEAIYEAFLEDIAFLCMEPALCDNQKGVLLSNGREKIFYSISDYGPRAIRKIANMEIPVYTSNIYMLCHYLFRKKVFNLNLKDVGIAFSMKTGEEVKGINDIVSTAFPECMDMYENIYLDCKASVPAEKKRTIELLENYTSLLCSDGNDFPFENKDAICRQDASASFSYLYEESNLPLISGKYLSVRAINNSGESGAMLKQQYMDTCIELNDHVPFVHGNIYILKSGTDGLLLYVTGSGSQIRKIQLYLSSSARRIFASSKPENPVVLEEKEQSYFLNRKNDQ